MSALSELCLYTPHRQIRQLGIPTLDMEFCYQPEAALQDAAIRRKHWVTIPTL